MNTLAPDVKNLLFFAKDLNYHKELNALCLQRIRCGEIVLIFTRKIEGNAIGKSSALDIDKHLLANLIIMYADDIESITRKLLSLHEWNMLPHLVLLDLQSFLNETAENAAVGLLNTSASAKPLMQLLSLTITALFDYTKFLARKHKIRQPSSARYTNSIAVLGAHSILTNKQVELLINLYFYEPETVHTELNAVQAQLLQN